MITKDGRGEPLEEGIYYYLQDTRTYVGDCVLWWGKDSRGYTCNLNQAGLYTVAQIRAKGENIRPWPVSFVWERTVTHVHADSLHEEKNA